IMVGGTIMAYLGGLHYWWPKISGRLYNEGLAKISAGIIFIGFNLTFFPQFIVGYLGMSRRYRAADRQPDGFAAVRTPCRIESVGRDRPRVDDLVAAADGDFRGDANRH